MTWPKGGGLRRWLSRSAIPLSFRLKTRGEKKVSKERKTEGEKRDGAFLFLQVKARQRKRDRCMELKEEEQREKEIKEKAS